MWPRITPDMIEREMERLDTDDADLAYDELLARWEEEQERKRDMRAEDDAFEHRRYRGIPAEEVEA